MSAKSVFAPADFFALRTPLLPFDILQAWGSQVAAPAAQANQLAQALAHDRTHLRTFLRTQLAQPTINEAIFIASPDLHSALTHWQENPDSEKGLRAERSLVRYFARMSGRATPFGLFSGCSLGRIQDKETGRGGDYTAFNLSPQANYQRHTRLDMDYLFALCEALGRDPEIRSGLYFFPNSSLYRIGGHYRYAEARLNGKVRDYHLVVIEANNYLEATLQRAHCGATPATLAATLVSDDPEITPADAAAYINELIDSQILVSHLAPSVTGREPIHGLIEKLTPIAPAVATALQATHTALTQLDADGVGAPPICYLAVAEALKQLPTPVELNRLFQVDMVKPANATLGNNVLTEIQQGIALLHRLLPTPTEDALTRFRERFVARYEERQVPLMEALDEELGIGFRSEQGADHAPLLAALHFPITAKPTTTEWGLRQQWLLGKLAAVWRSGVQTLELNEQDIATLTNPTPRPLPNSFALMTTIAARSVSELNQGDFTILLDGVSGPSGARLLGRFCHGDANLQRAVTRYLAAEAEHDPDALYAEIVHLPEGRIGNVLCRPLLRQYEIPYLGQPGTLPKYQLPVTDLLVSVVKGEIQLHSQRLQRRVIPRLTTAHNFTLRGQGVYMFLCSLQSQGVMPGLRWDWGALESADFLPRLTYQRFVLARARWRISQVEIQRLGKLKDVELWHSVQGWRQQRHLPRWVVLTDSDNELPIDLDNILSIESFIDTIKNRSEAILHELHPSPDELCVTGPEGAFVHEFVIPFVKTLGQETERQEDKATRGEGDKEKLAARNSQFATRNSSPTTRTFPPGSEWLYAKLYTGAATADRVLCDVIGPVVREAMSTGAADQWFFLRYGDPDWHLRVRLHGDPTRMLSEVLPQLYATAAPWLEDGRIWKVQLDTYQREVERYGGLRGIELAERLFHADSETVLAIVERLEGDAGAEARWQLAYAGIDLLLDDLGFDLKTKQTLMRRARDSFQREFRADSNLRSQLGEKHRQQRRTLDWLRDPARNQAHPFAPGIELLQQRSVQLRPLVAELHTAEQQGQLNAPLHEIAWSYLHMHANRLLRSAQRSQELVLYDLLDRHYVTQQARSRQQ